MAAPPMAQLPADGVIRLTELGYRAWGPEVVHYRIDRKRFRAATTELLGPDGKSVPFQISGDTLTFVAALEKGQTADAGCSHCRIVIYARSAPWWCAKLRGMGAG